MTTIRFVWGRRGEVEAALAKLAKRAAKLGLPFEATVSDAPTEETKSNDGAVVTRWGAVTLTQPTIALPGGWTLVAVLSPVPMEDGTVELLPTAVPGQVLPDGVRTWAFRCDHCQTARRRLETFVVRDEAGTLKQVGRNCLTDFLGHDAANALARYDFVASLEAELSEYGDGGGARAPDFLALDRIMVITSAIVRRDGFVSRKAADEAAAIGGHLITTRDDIVTWLWGRSPDDVIFRREHPVEAEDEAAAVTARAWWLAQADGENDYIDNGKLLARSGLVPFPRALGLAASMLPVSQRAAQKARETAARKANTPPWTAGRQEVTGTVSSAQWKSSDWGSYCGVTVITADGRLLWFRATAAMQAVSRGDGQGQGLCELDTITVKLTVSPKPEDPTFAWGKRPTLITHIAKEAP